MSQITLLTGPERRRRWRDEERLAILEEAFSPGACVSEVARRHEVSSSLIYTWRRNARTQTGDPAFVEAVMADAGSRSGPRYPSGEHRDELTASSAVECRPSRSV